MDIKFCILLFYMFLRNVMAFDKELAIFYGFFNLRISKQFSLQKQKPQWCSDHFSFFLIFVWFYIKMDTVLYKTGEFYVLNQSRSILWLPPNYTREK